MAAFILFLLLSCTLCYLMAAWPIASLLLAIVWGAVLITAGKHLKKPQLLAIFLANIAVIFYAGGLVNTIFIMALSGLAMMVMSYMVWRGAHYYELQKAGIAIAVVGLSIFLGITWFQTQDGWKQSLQSELDTYIEETMQGYEESGLATIYAEQGITREDLIESAEKASAAILNHLWAIFYLQVIMTVFFALLLAVFINRKSGDERLKKKPYNQEIMAWQLVWVIIAGLALCLWGSQQKNDQLFYIGSNILVVLTPVTVYYGLAAVIYKIGQMRETVRRWLTVILVILSTFFLPSALIFFSIFGMFDALLDYRKLRIEKGD
ncbi:MAG: DUF2232 domain-containing protein [Deltaproteobacteria bacterium]